MASASLSALHPQVEPLMRRFVDACAASGIPTRVIMTLRTLAEQDALYAQGRTAPGRVVTRARGYQSYHVWGVAADIAPLSVLAHPDWDPNSPAWGEMSRIAATLGIDHDVRGDKPHWDVKRGGHWRRWQAAYPNLVLPSDHFKRIP
jgi:peptidoglycan L-alanyl-D-glutamate endopeptidase CwlK